MAQFDHDTLGPALKEFYSGRQVPNLVYENNPFYGMIKKERMGGKFYDFPVEYELPASRSADITKALANKSASSMVEFNVTMVKDYIAISIDRETMYATEKSEMAFFSARTRSIDSALKQLVRSLAMSMYRNKGGAVGKIATGGISTNTITLDDIEEIANFGKGDRIVLSANDGSSTAHTLLAGTVLVVTNVNRDTGVLTFDVNVTAAFAAAAAGNFMFKDGDFKVKLAGLDSWCPQTAPSAGESFFGADRSPDTSRLAGTRFSGVGFSMSEAFLGGCARLGREGVTPTHILTNPVNLKNLTVELGNNAVYDMSKVDDADVGFKSIVFQTGMGNVNVHADHNCPAKKSYITRLDAWLMPHSSKAVPEIQDEDGSVLFREAGSDGFEVRMSYYANMCALNPQETCVVTHST